MPAKVKVEAVDTLTTKMGRAKSVILADYRGLTVEAVNDLRITMRKANIDYKVAKNRLMKIALKRNDYDYSSLDKALKGPSSFAIGFDDPITPAKIMYEFSKKNDKLKIKGGFLGKQALTAMDVEQLAKMPSREEMLTRVLRSITSPPQKLASALHQSVAKIAYALNAVAASKQG